MKHIYKHNTWFTLIELLVSITIFSIIMVSVITIFIFSSNLSAKVDINRSMQENIKNAVETIAEDVRKYEITWVWNGIWTCVLPAAWTTEIGNKLCICTERDVSGACIDERKYRLKEHSTVDLKKYNVSDSAFWSAKENSDCGDITTDHCVLFKDASPLTNSFVSFRELNFTLAWDQDSQKKVTVNFVIQPTLKRWVQSGLVKNSKIIFQTTLSERLIKSN